VKEINGTEGEDFRGLFFFIIQNINHFREFQNCIGGGFFGDFGGFT
jgi:hypothetical protein